MRIEWFQYFQLICLLIALLSYKKLRQFSLGIFIPILLLVNFTEFTGVNCRLLGWNNDLIYNLYTILITPLYLYAYFKMMVFDKNERVTFLLIAGLSMSFIILNFFFLQGMVKFNSYSGMLSNLLNVFFCGLILLRIITMEQEQITFHATPYFWIAASNLLVSMVTLVLLSLHPYIKQHKLMLGHESLYHAILPVSSAFLYSVYSYAFFYATDKR